mmetsp:Transcript_6826/g.19785  ORF Transcript_6826/g.19785 Transcript_6826/m.19785 type:complete len:271 (-) Transcript_6826:264-1076(-)
MLVRIRKTKSESAIETPSGHNIQSDKLMNIQFVRSPARPLERRLLHLRANALHNIIENLRLRAAAINLLENGLVRVADGFNVLVVGLEAHAGLLLGIVRALRNTRRDLLRGGRRILHVVDIAGLRVETAANHALNELVVRHVEEQEGVGNDASLGERVGLRLRAREAVQKPTLGLAVRLREALLHDADDDIIRHELTALHVPLGELAHLRPGLNRRAQHVARRQVHAVEGILDHGALGALARRRRAGNDDAGHLRGIRRHRRTRALGHSP